MPREEVEVEVEVEEAEVIIITMTEEEVQETPDFITVTTTPSRAWTRRTRWRSVVVRLFTHSVPGTIAVVVVVCVCACLLNGPPPVLPVAACRIERSIDISTC